MEHGQVSSRGPCAPRSPRRRPQRGDSDRGTRSASRPVRLVTGSAARLPRAPCSRPLAFSERLAGLASLSADAKRGGWWRRLYGPGRAGPGRAQRAASSAHSSTRHGSRKRRRARGDSSRAAVSRPVRGGDRMDSPHRLGHRGLTALASRHVTSAADPVTGPGSSRAMTRSSPSEQNPSPSAIPSPSKPHARTHTARYITLFPKTSGTPGQPHSTPTTPAAACYARRDARVPPNKASTQAHARTPSKRWQKQTAAAGAAAGASATLRLQRLMILQPV